MVPARPDSGGQAPEWTRRAPGLGDRPCGAAPIPEGRLAAATGKRAEFRCLRDVSQGELFGPVEQAIACWLGQCEGCCGWWMAGPAEAVSAAERARTSGAIWTTACISARQLTYG